MRTRELRLNNSETMSPNRTPEEILWAAAGFKDTELGVSMKPEVSHGATQVYARV